MNCLTCSNLFNLDLTLQGITPQPQLRLYRDPSPQTCSNLFIMKHVLLASGRLASHWNTFLFLQVEVRHIRLHLLDGWAGSPGCERLLLACAAQLDGVGALHDVREGEIVVFARHGVLYACVLDIHLQLVILSI